MNAFLTVVAPAFLYGVLTVALADDKPKSVSLDKITEKVSLAIGEAFTVEFKRDGDRLLQPSKSNRTDAKKAVVKVKLALTSASPVPPPREGATRPYLNVVNDFEKTLHFRALVRMRGSKEFFELADGIEPVPAEQPMNKCWDFDSLVEEVVLYEFKLSDQPTD